MWLEGTLVLRRQYLQILTKLKLLLEQVEEPGTGMP